MSRFLGYCLCCLVILLISISVDAAEEFVIEDIRVEGLQRLTPGTVFNYLPMKVGDTFNDARSAEAVRALFRTGFFNDVRLEREGNVLVFIIEERPTISSITITGNEDVQSEDLIDALRQIGVAEGRILNQSQLDKLELELRRQYFSLGKYAVKINTIITPLENNRVDIKIEVSEGLAAKIQRINIVGNESFDDDDLLDEFQLSTTTMFSFFTKNDQYSREKLSADLESLRSFYLDRGYINMSIDSTQVSITPDNKNIYITINITEDVQYTVADVKLAGEFIVPPESLFDAISVQRGELFSRSNLSETSEAITKKLGSAGYAFANVNAIPDINKEEKTVSITFFIDPGKRVYVRRINFAGNTKTRDEVLRREMRQAEGGWASTDKIERGKVRLQRLGYFSEVNVETPAVPGTADQIDVDYTVTETPSGQFSVGLGFSQSAGLIFTASVIQNNFLGSGKRMGVTINTSDFNRTLSLQYRNPYWTLNGISRGFNGFYRETQAIDANLTSFESTTYGGGINFGIPLTEFNTFFTSFDYENTKIDSDENSAQVVRDFVAANGNTYDIFRLINRFSYDTRNDAFFPDDGVLHSITAEVSLPVLSSSLEFYKVDYRTALYFGFFEDYIFSLRGNFGYGDGYADTTELPFFENFYAGGPRSVRGYEDNTLGPRDEFDRPLGGNVRLVGNAELVLPVPFLKDNKSLRISGFFDVGNVYANNEDIDLGELRYSTGLSGIWVSPFGIISVSYGFPINDQPGDRTQPFQFTFGSTF
jgi:outer membrane protein insertion porin family